MLYITLFSNFSKNFQKQNQKIFLTFFTFPQFDEKRKKRRTKKVNNFSLFYQNVLFEKIKHIILKREKHK